MIITYRHKYVCIHGMVYTHIFPSFDSKELIDAVTPASVAVRVACSQIVIFITIFQ